MPDFILSGPAHKVPRDVGECACPVACCAWRAAMAWLRLTASLVALSPSVPWRLLPLPNSLLSPIQPLGSVVARGGFRASSAHGVLSCWWWGSRMCHDTMVPLLLLMCSLGLSSVPVLVPGVMRCSSPCLASSSSAGWACEELRDAPMAVGQRGCKEATMLLLWSWSWRGLPVPPFVQVSRAGSCERKLCPAYWC